MHFHYLSHSHVRFYYVNYIDYSISMYNDLLFILYMIMNLLIRFAPINALRFARFSREVTHSNLPSRFSVS